MTEKELINNLETLREIDLDFDLEQGKKSLLKQLPEDHRSRKVPFYPLVALAVVLVLGGGLALSWPLTGGSGQPTERELSKTELASLNSNLQKAIKITNFLEEKSSQVVDQQKALVEQTRKIVSSQEASPTSEQEQAVQDQDQDQDSKVLATQDSLSIQDKNNLDPKLQLQYNIRQLEKQKGILKKSQDISQLLKEAKEDFNNKDFVLAREKIRKAQELIENLNLGELKVDASSREVPEEKVHN